MGGFRGGGMGMSMRAERSPHGRSARAGQAEPPKSKPNLRKIRPEVKALVVPRKGLIAIGLVLMAINRVAGLVLPFTARPLVDKVLSPQNPHPQLLPRYIAIVFSAMVVQALTSYALTQSLSKAGQRLIAELRRQVQHHVGLLSVAYYDENRTGTLVARIMTDVEGVRNLVGTGLVEFLGGLLTAVMVFIYMMYLSAEVTLTVFAVLGVFVFILQYGFKTIRPIFRERGKINAEVTGRLTESLGGVRVIKGYHAEEREAAFFPTAWTGFSKRDEVADHDQRPWPRLRPPCSAWCRRRHVAGRPVVLHGTLDARQLFRIQHVSCLHDRAGFPDGEHRHAID